MPGSFRNYGKIDPYVQFQYETKRKERRRILVIVAASIFLVVAVICITVGLVVHNKNSASSSSTNNTPNFQTGSAAIQAACNTTRYPETCNEEFNDNPESLTANPLQLVTLGVKIALVRVSEAHGLSLDLVMQAGLSRQEIMALEDCTELLGNTMDYLNTTVEELTSLDVKSLQETLQKVEVLLSTASSEQTACSDNFENITGSASSSMLLKQERVDEILINALYLVDALSSLGTDLTSWKSVLPSIPKIHLRRRLLSAESDNAVSAESDNALAHWASVMDRELVEAPTSPQGYNAVVAKDGSGDYMTLKAALKGVKEGYSGRWVIYIKAGTYNEGPLNISKSLINLTLLGDGCSKTNITGNANVALAGYTTYRSATLGIMAKGFLARGITISNTAGPSGHQAVAIRVNADNAVFDSCCFEGYQDTLYALSGKQFYRGCNIVGTVDFIFGNALAVFQNCALVAHLPAAGQQNTYTANGRGDKKLITGFAFQNCSLIESDALKNASYPVLTYLGRPWKQVSTSIFMQSYYGSHVNSAGWLSWNTSRPFETTCIYGEYMNTGPGSGVAGRVTWKCVNPALTTSQASQYTVKSMYGDTTFIPTDVSYQASL